MQNRALFIQIHYCQFKKACYNKFNPKKRKELFGKDGHENEEGYESAVPAGCRAVLHQFIDKFHGGSSFAKTKIKEGRYGQ